MRLPVTLLLSLSAMGCGGVASHKASSCVHVYSDERITAISPAVQDEVQIKGDAVTASYGADIVSGATQVLTVDAVSSATRFSDRRHQLGLAARHAFSPERGVSAAYGYSVERDHIVHAPSLGYSQELLDRAVRATIRYGWSFETVGRADDLAYLQRARGQRLDLGWTQILRKDLVLVFLGTGTLATCESYLGCFANPYRYVGVRRGSDVLALSERHPASRGTLAGALRLSWALGRSEALHFGYRLSGDSWRVVAHTVDAAFVTELLENRLLFRAETRATMQGDASFYAARYESGPGSFPAYRTADAELSTLWNLRILAQMEWRFDPLRLVLQLGRMWNRYPDFPSLPARTAWVGGLGVDWDF